MGASRGSVADRQPVCGSRGIARVETGRRANRSHEDGLVLSGERTFERDLDKGGTHRTEIRYGRFYRVIPLPDGASVDQAKAKFENGVLEVTFPLAEETRERRRIQVEGSGATSTETSQKAA